MLPVLQIGPLALQLPGLMLLLGLWMGLSLAEKFSIKRNYPADDLYNLVFITLISAVIGARLGFALQNLEAFRASPLNLVSLNPGLLDPASGFAAALAASMLYGQRKKLPFWATLDALTPLLAVFMVGLALAHITSGQAFGAETSLPWGIDLWGAKRQPSQFYELAGAVIILLISGRRANAPGAPTGTLFLAFLALTAGTRLFLEAFRGDSSLIFGGLRAMQVLAWLTLAAALWGLLALEKSQTEQES